MPEKYILRNVSGRDLVFVRPVNLRFTPGEEKTVFLSGPQANAFRQNPGEVELLRKLPPPAPGQEISLEDVKIEMDGEPGSGEPLDTVVLGADTEFEPRAASKARKGKR